ncbi:MAG TPA: pitrilysin family protein [Rhizomicrobium sp.]|jgi:zinc protease|nr:pitrilysin family protein [Rhizomicrobium sp.]
MRARVAIAGLAAFFALAATPADAFNARQLKAPRGEEVWFAENHALPMIALTAAFPAGSAYDPKGKEGLAEFAASLLDEGAGKLDSTAFHAALADRAIQLSVDVDRDWTIVTLVTLTSHAKEAFKLLGLALAHPRFDNDAIARVRAQMLQNLKQEDEDPAEVAARDFHLVFFGEHPYAHAPEGTAPGVNAVSRDDLRNFAASHWVRSGLDIAVAGDIDAATLSSMLKSTFGVLRASQPPLPPPPGRLGAPGLHIFAMPVPQPNAIFALPGMLRSHPDYIPAYVASYILGGGGFSSRLTSEVREKRGLTYDISTDVPALRRAGLIEGQVATRADAMGKTIAVVRDTFAKFSTDGPTAQELADAKTYLTGSYPLAFSSNVGIAAQLGAFQRAGLPVGYIAKRNALIEAVTLDDVRRVAKKWFDPKRLTVVVAGTIINGGKKKR